MLPINRDSLRSQKGMTLLEIIVAIPIIAILSMAAATLLMNGIKSYRYTQLQAQGSYQVSNYLERVSRVVRGANDLVAVSSNSITFHGYFSPRDNVPDQIRYFIDANNNLSVGTIVATGTAPNYTYPAGNEKITLLISGLQNSPNTLFSFYDSSGNQLSGAFSISAVREIGIRLDINPDPKFLNNPITGQTRVSLRNLKTNL